MKYTRKITKKNLKKIRFRTRMISLHRDGRNSLERIFRFRRTVSISEMAIVKLTILALMAKMIMGSAWLAFTSLGEKDKGIGPANNGGYYLIGFRNRTFSLQVFGGSIGVQRLSLRIP
jgi:hypothetical protein